MDRKTALVTTATLLGSLGFWVGPAATQSSSLKQQLVGTWTYVNAYNIMPNGARIEPQGQNGKGGWTGCIIEARAIVPEPETFLLEFSGLVAIWGVWNLRKRLNYSQIGN